MLYDENKIETIVKRNNVFVFSVTIAKFLMFYENIYKTIGLSVSKKIYSPQECVYCQRLQNHFCKKHSGLEALVQQNRKAAITTNEGQFLFTKNWIFVQKDNIISEIYMPHFKVLKYKFDVFSFLNNLRIEGFSDDSIFEVYQEELLAAKDLTKQILNNDILWTHAFNDEYLVLRRERNTQYTFKFVNYFNNEDFETQNSLDLV